MPDTVRQPLLAIGLPLAYCLLLWRRSVVFGRPRAGGWLLIACVISLAIGYPFMRLVLALPRDTLDLGEFILVIGGPAWLFGSQLVTSRQPSGAETTRAELLKAPPAGLDAAVDTLQELDRQIVMEQADRARRDPLTRWFFAARLARRINKARQLRERARNEVPADELAAFLARLDREIAGLVTAEARGRPAPPTSRRPSA